MEYHHQLSRHRHLMISINHTNQEKGSSSKVWGSHLSKKPDLKQDHSEPVIMTQLDLQPKNEWEFIMHKHTHVSCKEVCLELEIISWNTWQVTKVVGSFGPLWIAFLPFYMDANIESLLLCEITFLTLPSHLIYIDFDYIVT